MSDQETFEKWFNPFDEKLGSCSKYEAIKNTWNHQAKKIAERDARIERQDKIISELKKCVQFYDNRDNWLECGAYNFMRITSEDNRDMDDPLMSCGGKTARETLKRVEGTDNERSRNN